MEVINVFAVFEYDAPTKFRECNCVFRLVPTEINIMKKILVVCGNGLGTSLMMEMAVKEVAKKIGFEAEIDHEDLSSAASSKADIWVAATDIANQLKDAGKENVISLANIFDKPSIEEQLKQFM